MTLAVLVMLSGTEKSAAAGGALTLPIVGFNVSSWFDHTSPASGGAGLTDNSTTMTRYDGTSGHSYNGHAGLDYGTGPQPGYNVVAATDGTVQFVGWENANNTKQGFGFYVRVWHASLGYSTLYGHMDGTSLVTNGQYVSRGTVVGHSGNSGRSDGPHLHFGVYNSQSGWTPMDPYGWSGGGSDPWASDIGYLWTTNPPSSQPPHYWHAWQGWGSAADGSPPMAISYRDDALDHTHMAKRNSGDIWIRWWDGIQWQPCAVGCWQNLSSLPGDPVFTGQVAISNHSGRIYILAVASGVIWLRYWDGTVWSGWQSLGSPGSLNGPVAISYSNGQITVAANVQGNVWFKKFEGGWTGWQNLGGGGTLIGDIAISNRGPGVNNLIHIVARRSDNIPFIKWYNGSGWVGWDILDVNLSQVNGPLAIDNTNAIAGNFGSTHYNVHVVAVVGLNVWIRCWDNTGACSTSGWFPLGGNSTLAGPLTIANQNAQIHIVSKDTGAGLWHKWWD